MELAPEGLEDSIFNSVLKRPALYAEDWRTFRFFIWGAWHATENQKVGQDWMNFLTFINARYGLPTQWPDNYTQPERALDVIYENCLTDEDAFRTISALYKAYCESK